MCKKHEKREEQEVLNFLKLKFGGEICTRKSHCFLKEFE